MTALVALLALLVGFFGSVGVLEEYIRRRYRDEVVRRIASMPARSSDSGPYSTAPFVRRWLFDGRARRWR